MSEPRAGDGRFKTLSAFVLFWIVALVFCLGTLNLVDDHFGRISPGSEILVFGELPFRDFLDPGYFLTEFSSAAMQWLFGRSLVGELLLNALCIATGCLLVSVLTRRVTGSLAGALATGALALLALPRAYDYDKVLFYPLGIWAGWRWLAQPRTGRLTVLAVTLVTAGLYRYDNGAFLLVATIAAVAVVWWDDHRQLLKRVGSLVLAVAVVSALPAVFIQTHGGLVNAADQALAYGVRERERTHLSSYPRIHVGTRIVGLIPVPPSENMVRVRWAAGLAGTERQRLARRFGLDAEVQDGAPERRTWRYVMPDPSTDRLRLLVNDPRVEDTDGIDRSRLVLLNPESRLLRLERWSPVMRVRVLPEAWTVDNAQSVYYYVLLLLPVVSAVLLAVRWRLEREHRAKITLLIVLTALLDVFVLRDPFMARAGGIAGPLAVLGAWAVPRLPLAVSRDRGGRGRRMVRAAAAGAALLVGWSLVIALDWPHQLNDLGSAPSTLTPRLTEFAKMPPELGLLPSGHLAEMVRYVRRCTLPSDRVFISWFQPELFYFAQRGFGGGMSATFGSHWSEPRFQERSITAFETRPTPIVVLRAEDASRFRADYPLLDAYFVRRYRLAGQTNFGNAEVDPDGYRVFVRIDRTPTSLDQETGLPCFGNR